MWNLHSSSHHRSYTPSVVWKPHSSSHHRSDTPSVVWNLHSSSHHRSYTPSVVWNPHTSSHHRSDTPGVVWNLHSSSHHRSYTPSVVWNPHSSSHHRSDTPSGVWNLHSLKKNAPLESPQLGHQVQLAVFANWQSTIIWNHRTSLEKCCWQSSFLRHQVPWRNHHSLHGKWSPYIWKTQMPCQPLWSSFKCSRQWSSLSPYTEPQDPSAVWNRELLQLSHQVLTWVTTVQSPSVKLRHLLGFNASKALDAVWMPSCPMPSDSNIPAADAKSALWIHLVMASTAASSHLNEV